MTFQFEFWKQKEMFNLLVEKVYFESYLLQNVINMEDEKQNLLYDFIDSV